MLCVLRSICLSSNPIFKWSIRCQVLIPYHSSCYLITPYKWRWCALIQTHTPAHTQPCVDSKLSGKQLKYSGWRSCSSWATARISAICHKIFSVSSPWTLETTLWHGLSVNKFIESNLHGASFCQLRAACCLLLAVCCLLLR